MMAAVNSGPVAIYWTSTWNWMIYGGGIYDRYVAPLYVSFEMYLKLG